MTGSGFSAEVGRQQFLELMVTQLQHQDPLEPVGQQEFLEQLAQFSVVEGVEQLNSQFSDMLQLQVLTDGAQIVGRVVEYVGDGGSETGVVRAAEVEDGRLQLDIDGHLVPIDAVQRVGELAVNQAA